MKIYKLKFDVSKYDILTPETKMGYEFYQMFDGRRISEEWHELKVVRMNPKSKKPIGDVIPFEFTMIVASKKALDLLMPLMGQAVEVLPFEFEGKKMYGLNVIDVVDAVDYRNSEYVTFDSSDKIMYFEKYAFLCEKLTGKSIFKIPDAAKGHAFVTEKVSDLIEEAGLKGFKLEEVYDSELKQEKSDQIKEVSENSMSHQDDEADNIDVNDETEELFLSKGDLEQLTKMICNRTKRHAVKVELKADAADLCSSKVGGYPYWAKDKEYPTDSDGNKLLLLAQINLSDFEFEDLPDNGLLQFFVSFNDCLGLNDKKGYKVVYHEFFDENVKEDDIKKMGIPGNVEVISDDKHWFPTYQCYRMVFKKSENDVVCLGDYKFEENLKSILNEELKIDVKDKDILSCMNIDAFNYLADRFDTYQNKICGNPNFCQGDPRLYIGDKEKYDTLLLQLVSDVDEKDSDLMFGDGGACNFLINHYELEKRCFDDVLFNWECG